MYWKPRKSEKILQQYRPKRFKYVLLPIFIKQSNLSFFLHTGMTHAVRALMLTSLIVIILAGVATLVVNCSSRPKYPINKCIVAGLCLMSFVLTTTGWSLYIKATPNNERDGLTACFGLAIVSSFLSLLNGAIALSHPPLRRPATALAAAVVFEEREFYPFEGAYISVPGSAKYSFRKNRNPVQSSHHTYLSPRVGHSSFSNSFELSCHSSSNSLRLPPAYASIISAQRYK